MIGVIGAMQIEIDGLKEQVQDPKIVTISGVEFVTGTIHGTDVVLAVCGMGKVFAAICAQAMITEFHVDALVTTGVAVSYTHLIISIWEMRRFIQRNCRNFLGKSRIRRRKT